MLNANKRFRGGEPAAIFSLVSLISVGRSAVVPNLRCAAAIVRMASGVGASFNNTSPPPLTWMSMKPGASQALRGSSRTGTVAGTSSRGTIGGNLVVIDQYRRVVMQSDAVENLARRDGVNA